MSYDWKILQTNGENLGVLGILKREELKLNKGGVTLRWSRKEKREKNDATRAKDSNTTPRFLYIENIYRN
jgi:hypothetical protein